MKKQNQMSKITYGELYRFTLDELNKITQSASVEAGMLFNYCFGLDRIGVTVNSDKPADEKGVELLRECIKKRSEHFPIQYILGKRSFYDYEFIVGEGVLIPRPETEMLVEQAAEFIRSNNITTPVIFDLCSGSGCIGITLAKLFPEANVYCFEKSDIALGFIKKNIELNNVVNVRVIEYDIFDGLPLDLSHPDILVSNPPYIPTNDISELESEVRKEPVMALDGGTDGLMFYRCICDKWLSLFNKSVFFALEFGIDQSGDIAEIFSRVSDNTEILNDFNGIDRVVCGKTDEIQEDNVC